jgi:hypothetical protein
VRLDGGWRSVALLELGGISAPRTGVILSAPLSVYIRQGGFRSSALLELGGISALSVPVSKADAPLSVAVQQAGAASAAFSAAVQTARTASAALSAQIVSTASGFRGIAALELGGISAAPPQTPRVPVYDDGVPQARTADLGWSAVYAYQPLGVQPAYNQTHTTVEAALSVVVRLDGVQAVPLSFGVQTSAVTSAALSVYIGQDGGFRSLLLIEAGGLSAAPPEDPRVLPYDDGVPLAWTADLGWASAYAYQQIGTQVFSRVSRQQTSALLSAPISFSRLLEAPLSVVVFTAPELSSNLSAAVENGVEASAALSVALLEARSSSADMSAAVSVRQVSPFELSVPVETGAELLLPASAAVMVQQVATSDVDVAIAEQRASSVDVSLMVLVPNVVTVDANLSAAVMANIEKRVDLSVATLTQPEHSVGLSLYVDTSHPVSVSADMSAAVQVAQSTSSPMTAVVVNASTTSAPLSVMVLRAPVLQAALSVQVNVPYTTVRAPSGSGFAPRKNDMRRPRR